MNLSREEILTVVGIVVGIIAIVVGALAARRWGARRGKVFFEFSSTGLIPEDQVGPGKLLKVTFRDFEVNDPHLVTLRLRNVGPSDVSSSHFDAGKPVVISLNCTMFGVTSTSHPDSTMTTAVGGEGVVELRPCLLVRGEEWLVTAVVGGKPNPKLTSPLIDTDIVDVPSFVDRIPDAALGFGSVFLNSLATTLIGPIRTSNYRRRR